MLDLIPKICYDAGRLTGARYALLDGDAGFIAAIELQFERMSAVFRANPSDDTLEVSIGSLILDMSETGFDATNLKLWSRLRGLRILWVWQLTNQQGYSDGARFEFNTPKDLPAAVVEFVVVASAIQILVASPAVLAEQAVATDLGEERRSG